MEDRFHILIARKISGALDASEAEELDQILAADPSRQLILDWFEQMLSQEKHKLPSFESREAYVRHWLKYRAEITQSPLPENHSSFWTSGKKRATAILGVFVVTLLGFGIWWMLRPVKETHVQDSVMAANTWQTYVTQVSEKRKLSLPDGSVVWLNAGSNLRYDPEQMRKGSRQVFLEGEAFFDIAHDASRPFKVRSGVVEIKVLGTAFNVKAYPEDVNIETSLIRGSVEVRLDDRPDDVYQLRPHEKLVVSRQTQATVNLQASNNTTPSARTMSPLVSLKRIAVADSGLLVEETAWLQNKLVFRSERFSELAKMLERKYGYHFVFEGADLMELEFTGSFTTETVGQALDAMRLVHVFEYRIDKENIYIR